MNIYLDIDGVLLANELALAPHAEEFLNTVLDKYPNSTFWLTTHCWRGDNRAAEVLSPYLNPELTDRIKQIQPTEWGEVKTDAIDFSQPFLWFDDDLYPDEKAALEANDAIDSWIGIDLTNDPNQLQKQIEELATLKNNL